MSRVRYVPTGDHRDRPEGVEPSAREKKPTLARDGFEVLVDRGERNGNDFSRKRELCDVEWEPTVSGGIFSDDGC